MDNKQREEIIMTFLSNIDFMANYSPRVYFNVAPHPVIFAPSMHKRHVRRLNKILKKSSLSHVKVVVENLIREKGG